MYILLSILSSTSIAVLFKIQDRIKVKLFPVIVLNYISASLLGVYLSDIDFTFTEILRSDWILIGALIGILLILGFYLIGFSTQKVGIAVTTVSNKMSVVIPILFSMFYFNEEKDAVKYIGIILALTAILLSVFKKRKQQPDLRFIWLPVLLFFAIGIIDTLVKLAQTKLEDEQIPVFTAVSFGLAFIAGLIGSLFNSTKLKDFFNIKTIVIGLILGVVNFGSMFFLIQALDKSKLDSSVVFGINNVGIISISVLLAFFIFRERLKLINWIGIGVSIVSILILSNLIL